MNITSNLTPVQSIPVRRAEAVRQEGPQDCFHIDNLAYQCLPTAKGLLQGIAMGGGAALAGATLPVVGTIGAAVAGFGLCIADGSESLALDMALMMGGMALAGVVAGPFGVAACAALTGAAGALASGSSRG